MYSYLQGKLVEKNPTEIVIDVNGVGYSVNISLGTYEKLPEVNSSAKILTYLHLREDVMHLYGFATDAERALFKLLISVSGIGPRMAQGILSGIGVSELKEFIIQGNLGALMSISGVGKKIAERLVVELRDKIGRLEFGAEAVVFGGDKQAEIRAEALLALISLGFTRVVAEKGVRVVLKEANGAELTVEDLIKRALRHTTK
jgi:Holliday junction DNA helicase RuvA